ncbi:sigma-70 family RNA polymerase sigma factor [Edaphobacillus lindanitolerans]|uniref:RNA polymerase sigma-70 factor, ECF subfamily n=1 Tax=Edaphobacillus lindanitolerans TaxID=550447 RepID=A0A1U7PSU2_9BACI|nr:sigma-70 family RNA polymerase sigma factor [Edaphobacillus lindanitolerans]SIT91613.1 RNA polymerase sigma-70 factor, ECF subfamily [Edaphobacillus lindanitolerans]
MIENWADHLITEYTVGRKALHAMKERYDENDPYQKQDVSHINSMIDSMTYSMEWMETGREPGTFRGMDKQRQYQRQFFESVETIPDIVEELGIDIIERRLEMDTEMKILLTDLFVSMSHRERECFILHSAQGMSMGKIAKTIGVSKATVQSYINRARKKVEEIIA